MSESSSEIDGALGAPKPGQGDNIVPTDPSTPESSPSGSLVTFNGAWFVQSATVTLASGDKVTLDRNGVLLDGEDLAAVEEAARAAGVAIEVKEQ